MTTQRKPTCAMCGRDRQAGIYLLDIFICNTCQRKHPDKMADELLGPFLRKYFDEAGKLTVRFH